LFFLFLASNKHRNKHNCGQQTKTHKHTDEKDKSRPVLSHKATRISFGFFPDFANFANFANPLPAGKEKEKLRAGSCAKFETV